jgi:hypothetical protein
MAAPTDTVDQPERCLVNYFQIGVEGVIPINRHTKSASMNTLEAVKVQSADHHRRAFV